MAKRDIARMTPAEHREFLSWARRYGSSWKKQIRQRRMDGRLEGPAATAFNKIGPSGLTAYRLTMANVENPGRKRPRKVGNPAPKRSKALDSFTDAYIDAALWSSTDDDGDSLDRNYSVRDIAPATLTRMKLDARKFQRDNARSLDAGSSSRGGHDFWLTRAGHGAGFWDGDWPEPEATRLTNAAKAFGDNELYVGDDGRIHAVITKRRIGKKRPAGAKTSGRKRVSSTKQRNPARKRSTRARRAKPRKRTRRSPR